MHIKSSKLHIVVLRVALKTKFWKQVLDFALDAALLTPGASTIDEILGALCLLRQAQHCSRQAQHCWR
jgi:hypothetical protein